MVVVLMGVSGSGKSTVGALLASALSAEFIEGDDYHGAAVIEKMQRGVPLTETDRKPWLERLRAEIDARLAAGETAVVACSALSAASRRLLGTDRHGVELVHLRGDRETIAPRLARRAEATGHFMPPALLQSQLDALEPPAVAHVADVSQTPEEIVAAILEWLPSERAGAGAHRS
jgi:gluconokinase